MIDWLKSKKATKNQHPEHVYPTSAEWNELGIVWGFSNGERVLIERGGLPFIASGFGYSSVIGKDAIHPDTLEPIGELEPETVQEMHRGLKRAGISGLSPIEYDSGDGTNYKLMRAFRDWLHDNGKIELPPTATYTNNVSMYEELRKREAIALAEVERPCSQMVGCVNPSEGNENV